MKNLITGCQGVLRTTHNCWYLQSTDTVWRARTERCKVQELYTRCSLHLLEVTLPYLSHYLFSLQFFMQELKADTNAADASPRSLAFSLPFRTTPRTSMQFQTKKKSWLKLIFIDTREMSQQEKKPGRDLRKRHETAHCCYPKFAVCAWADHEGTCQEKLPAYKSHWHKAALKTADT